MKIALLDSGIDAFTTENELSIYAVIDESVQPVSKNTATSFSHGSYCAKLAIHGLKDTEIVSIQIYSETSDGSADDLCTALRWCISQKFDIVSMSNGTLSRDRIEEINSLCYQLHSQGVRVIAAVSNTWNYSIPACLPYVIGVERYRFARSKSTLSDIMGNGLLLRRNRQHRIALENGNSFACARYCGKLARKQSNAIKIRLPSWMDFTLLKNIITWSWSNINKELLTFQCLLMDHNNIGNQEAISLLVTDEFDSTELRKWIEDNKKSISVIMWCHQNVPKYIRNLCAAESIRLWVKPPLRKLRYIKQAIKVDSFVVLWNSNQDAFDSLNWLKRRLTDLSYSVLMFSRSDYCYLYGFIYIETLKQVEDDINHFLPDIVFVDLQNVDSTLFQYDLCVVATADNLIELRTDEGEAINVQNIQGLLAFILNQKE